MIRESLHKSVYWHQDTVQEILFEMLQKRGVYMEPKSFAVGLRIEHPQEMINMDLYGEPENELLGAASCKVNP